MPLVVIGYMAKRTPDGNFLPGVPIYRDIPELEPGEEYLPIKELSEMFAEKFVKYKKAKMKAEKEKKELLSREEL